MAVGYNVRIYQHARIDGFDGNGSSEAAIFIRGVFTPALPCAQQGFFLTSSDPLFQQTLAIILTAKASGALLGNCGRGTLSTRGVRAGESGQMFRLALAH